ncbi:MAG TPA: divalent-cation tolerance protein CutA [Acidimicrobiales bacterium]|nr:divalent-cation tolerance protein CutA [Acidimicrobiales bacterium]
MPAPYSAVITTAGSKEDAKGIAKALLDAKLAACVQLLPIDSLYTWKGEVAEEAEVLLLIKTREALYPELEKTIRAVHKYDTPEVIQLPIMAGLGEYLTWIDEVT